MRLIKRLIRRLIMRLMMTLFERRRNNETNDGGMGTLLARRRGKRGRAIGEKTSRDQGRDQTRGHDQRRLDKRKAR